MCVLVCFGEYFVFVRPYVCLYGSFLCVICCAGVFAC